MHVRKGPRWNHAKARGKRLAFTGDLGIRQRVGSRAFLSHDSKYKDPNIITVMKVYDPTVVPKF